MKNQELTQIFNALNWLLDVYAYEFTLPDGECYPTEPFGEIGAQGFVERTLTRLRDVPTIVRQLENENEQLFNALYVLKVEYEKLLDENIRLKKWGVVFPTGG
jgi:hypothetical protein